ncbi:MAG: Na/Pi cotransporter family protein [Planctomycetes bacterium]|nr:Na/Pi cotransporter family protein [Planctomycetota bacterium]
MDWEFVKELSGMLVTVIGGLGVFLLGMKNMSEGMQAVAGGRMRALINAVTNNRFMACGVGLVITMLIQSSSVTTVMVVGMVNATLMNLTQAIGVILGADIGTTVTGWIMISPISEYGLPMMGFAAFFFLFSKNERLRYTAMLILGLGMVFFGLILMKGGFAPLREMDGFRELMARFRPDNYFGVLRCCLVGAAVTAVVQSSSATLVITIAMVGTGVLDFETAAALVLGENIGTTITACLGAIGASTNAKRAAAAHVIIKVLGVAWITALFFPYMKLMKTIVGADLITTTVLVKGIPTYTHAMKAIAMSHTAFNIANVIIMIPFTTVLASILMRIMPDKVAKEVSHLKFLDVRMLDTPAISIQQSQKEIMRMGELTRKMLVRLKDIISKRGRDEVAEGKIFRREDMLDVSQKEIVEFLSSLLSGNVPHDVMDNGRKQLRMADEYESIGDYITTLLKLNLKMDKGDMEMLSETRDEIIQLHERVLQYLSMINEAVKEDNVRIVLKAGTLGDAITHLIKEYRTNHLERVESGDVSALKSLIITDMLNAYRRVKDHALNIAEVLAGEK